MWLKLTDAGDGLPNYVRCKDIVMVAAIQGGGSLLLIGELSMRVKEEPVKVLNALDATVDMFDVANGRHVKPGAP